MNVDGYKLTMSASLDIYYGLWDVWIQDGRYWYLKFMRHEDVRKSGVYLRGANEGQPVLAEGGQNDDRND